MAAEEIRSGYWHHQACRAQVSYDKAESELAEYEAREKLYFDRLRSATARIHELEHGSEEFRALWLEYLRFLLSYGADPTFIDLGISGALKGGEYVLEWTDPELEELLASCGQTRFALGAASRGRGRAAYPGRARGQGDGQADAPQRRARVRGRRRRR